MRAEGFTPLQPGDWMTVSEGLYAGIDGRIVEVREVVGVVLRVRLELPWGEEEWHAVWNEPMDEAEWLSTRDTAGLERYLCKGEPPLSERKFWLYRVACARRVWEQLPDFAREMFEDQEWRVDNTQGGVVTRERFRAVSSNPFRKYRNTRAEADAQRELLRDIFGNPFRQPIIDPRWLEWQAGLIVQLARTIYDERRFSELPILADALEDAGCRDETILDHGRRDAPHARGCWLLDSLLGLA
jgi:hypothetical protein